MVEVVAGEVVQDELNFHVMVVSARRLAMLISDAAQNASDEEQRVRSCRASEVGDDHGSGEESCVHLLDGSLDHWPGLADSYLLIG